MIPENENVNNVNNVGKGYTPAFNCTGQDFQCLLTENDTSDTIDPNDTSDTNDANKKVIGRGGCK